ncbi:hypothetical protein AXF42_Ash013241 [Apostasia shenzhenica]|uniref:TLDc domain-containing protein n=1 Tax=Apostasia shenzhenica TaxID=1088818 RepID=A0A2I0BBF4_9ASPA|nr:hypothetical protein AXF42_Ash013241 [Apostasia shenzhenica]
MPSQKRSTISSFLLSMLPATCSGAGNAPSSSFQTPKAYPTQSCKIWKSNGFDCKDRPLETQIDGRQSESDCDSLASDIKEHVKDGFERSASVAVLSSLNDSEVLLPFFMETSTFISGQLFDFLQSCLPNIVKGCQWLLSYSTLKHGISLKTLLRRSASFPGPCLLIVGDMQGAVFGGFLDCPIKPTAKRKYQGTNQTFVFTTIYGEPRLFRATGANRYYYLCLNDILAFGGGGSFALSLEEDLLHGTSGPCETFGNLCLAHSEEFELKNVEVMFCVLVVKFLKAYPFLYYDFQDM